MKKVLLIQPPMTLLKNEIKSVVFPLGLAYIAASLEKNGFVVEVIDAVVLGQESTIVREEMLHFGLDWPEIYKRIENANPNIVGISCLFSSQSKNAYKVAELAKQWNSKVPVIMGGAHPSSIPKEVLSNKNIDYVIIGEGDETIIELINNLNNVEKLKNIDGLGFKCQHSSQQPNQQSLTNQQSIANNQESIANQESTIINQSNQQPIIINPKNNYIQDLDALPFPARHLFPMSLYFNSDYGHGMDLMRKPISSMITSRGCPYNCVYCSVHTVWGRNYRPRSPKNVVDEIELLVKEYGVREIHFEDDNLTLKKERIIEICKEIINRKLDIKWTTPNGVALWTLDKEVLGRMKKSGCYKLCFGIESGDPETQKFIRKSVPLDKCKEIVREANKLGIWTHGFFIIGFPFEDKNSIDNTLKYAIKSDLDFASFFLATPYPKTDLYAIMNKEGMVQHLTWDSLRVSSASINTKYFTRDELTKIQKDLFKKFVLSRACLLLNPVKLGYRLKRLKNKEDRQLLIRFAKRFVQVVN